MLFETQFAAPAEVLDSPYQQHRLLQHIFASQHRDFVWAESDGIIFVRRRIPTNDLAWHPVDVPQQQSVITLNLQARARSSRGDTQASRKFKRFGGEPPRVSRGNRQSFVEPAETMAWLEGTGPTIGLRIEDVEVEDFSKLIAKSNHQFTVSGTSFVAVATVLDRTLFEEALVKGVGDSKAFGFGFIHFWRRGEHA